MREKVRDRGRLEHILEAIESIEEFHAQYTFEDIKKNKLIFYGFTKLVEVIGEAVYMLSTEFRDSHSDVNWRQIERMRHVLVHIRIMPRNTKKSESLFQFMNLLIALLQKNGQYRTSLHYRATLNSFKRYRDNKDIALSEIDAEVMRSYEAYLHHTAKVCRNTSSFYLRILRATMVISGTLR